MADVRRIVRDVVAEQFGDIVAVVAAVLYDKGRQTMTMATVASELKLKQVQQALFVLVQHLLVRTKTEHESKLGRSMVWYELDVSAVKWRLYFPRFLAMTLASHGTEATAIVRALMLAGRLTKTQLLAAVAANEPELLDPVRVQRSLEALVAGRFVLDFANYATFFEMTDPAPASLSDLPSTAPPCAGAGAPVHGPKASKRRKLATPEASAPEFHKVEDGRADLAVQLHGASWCLHPPRFLMQMRNTLCANLVRELISDDAALVLQCAFEIAEPNMVQLCHRPSDQIFNPSLERSALLIKLRQRVDRAGPLVDIMSHPTNGFFRIDGAHTLVIAVDSMLNTMRSRIIHAILKEKFGPTASRIFRLLIDKQLLEQKQVASLAMIPANDARVQLYQMLKAGFVALQEVPRAPDRAAARTYFLWRVDQDSTIRLLSDSNWKMLANVRQRAASEIHAQTVLLERAAAAKAQVASALAESAAAAAVTEPLKQRFKRRMSVQEDGIGAAAIVFRRPSLSHTAAPLPAEDVRAGGGERPRRFKVLTGRIPRRDGPFGSGGRQTESDKLLSAHDQAELVALRRRIGKLELAEQRLLESGAILGVL